MRGLKIATIICYCLIIIPATHVAAPLIFILFIFLGSGNAGDIVLSGLIFFILLYFLRSAVRPKRKRDIYVFILGGLILFIPLIQESIWLKKFEFEQFYEDSPFFYSSLPFIILLLITILSIFRSKNDQEKSFDAL